MGVLGRRAPKAGEPTPVRAPMKVLRADGRRIDLTSRDTSKYLAATKQAWQADAFAYRDLIGELRYAVRILAEAVARVRFYPAQARPWPDDPVAIDSPECTLDAQLVADIQANFDRLPFDHNPDGFTARLVENLVLAGEVWVHIDADDVVTVRSISEVSSSSGGQVVINTLPGGTASGQRVLDVNTEELLRLWRAHPEYGELADSPMRALSHVAEDVVLAGREQRAAARSRLAANGILFIPKDMSLLKTRDPDEDDDPQADTFMADLTAAMMAPIETNDEDTGQVVPIVIRADSDDIEKVLHLTISREDSAQLVARQFAALQRLLKGLPVQPEQIDGVGGMNHWGAWSVDARALKDQVQPEAETVGACFVQAFMKPALTSLGHDAKAITDVMIAADVSNLAENPNRGQDARDGHASGVLSDAALLRELGFDEADAPTDDEKLKRLAATGNLPVAVTAALFGLSGQDLKTATVIQGQIADDNTTPAGGPAALPPGKSPAVSPGQVVPSRPIPAPPTTAPVTASAAPAIALHVDIDASRRLADIDALLAERITVAADAALNRVLERAGAKVRGAAQKDRALAGRLGGVEAQLVASTIGRERVEQFVPVHDLLADGYARLRTQVSGWLGQAAEQAGDAMVAILGVDGETAILARKTVATRLANTADRAWPILADALDEAAEHYLFEPGDDAPMLAAQDIVDALAAAGGDDLPPLVAAAHHQRRNRRPIKRAPRSKPGSGFATGPVVTQAIAAHGGILLGHEWRYRPERARSSEFRPHRHLDGVRFTAWDDAVLDTSGTGEWVGPFFRPGDHKGCGCGTAPVYALVSDPDSEPARLLREAGGDPLKVHGATAQDLKDRIKAAADDMRRDVITKPRRRR